jgi:hypothetical protein
LLLACCMSGLVPCCFLFYWGDMRYIKIVKFAERRLKICGDDNFLNLCKWS